MSSFPRARPHCKITFESFFTSTLHNASKHSLKRSNEYHVGSIIFWDISSFAGPESSWSYSTVLYARIALTIIFTKDPFACFTIHSPTHCMAQCLFNITSHLRFLPPHYI